MKTHGPKTFLVITADDFGQSSAANQAIADAHDKGIVTSASIMPAGLVFDEALCIAKERKKLSLGLHVTLCDGRAVLPQSAIPDLVDADGYFEKDPARAWMQYSLPGMQEQLDAEIKAQFDFLALAGIRAAHVDSHHHLHMHPALFSLVAKHAARHNAHWIRIPNEPFSFMARFRDLDRKAMPFLEWGVFRALCGGNRKKALAHGLHVPTRCYGLSRTGRIDLPFLQEFSAQGIGVLELFAHPDTETERGRKELETLMSPEARKVLTGHNLHLVGYQELSPPSPLER